jgi:hypothetical protein
MSLVFVSVISFIVFLVGTLIFPSLPPGQTIIEALGNFGSDYFILGIPGQVFFSGIINGLIWGLIIILVYSYFKGPGKETVDLPVWVPGYTTSHNSKIENKSSNNQVKAKDIETINGIGYVYGRKLRKIGIKTLNDLFQVGNTRAGRKYLAKNIGVPPSTVLKWIYQAERNS